MIDQEVINLKHDANGVVELKGNFKRSVLEDTIEI